MSSQESMSYDLAHQMVISIHKDLKKDTETHIANNSEFFNKLSGLKKIYVLGFSFNYPDIPYLQHIIESASQDVFWHISYYGENKEKADIDRQEKEDFCRLHKIDSSRFSLQKIEDIVF